MTPPERDHTLLRPDPVDTSIWSTDVEMSDRHWREDNIAGWANDPRPLYLRIAEVLVENLIAFAAVAITLFVIGAVFLD